MNSIGFVSSFVKSMASATSGIRLSATKNAPAICVLLGIGTGIAATIKAGTATIKAVDVLNDSKEKMDKVEEALNTAEITDYSEDDAAKDRRAIRVQTIYKVGKLYAPVVLLSLMSAGFVLGGHSIQRRRNAALSAAYMAMDQSFKEYRKRVADFVGEEEEKKIRYGIKAEDIVETVKDPETGEEHAETHTITTGNIKCSPYARFFDESSAMWVKSPEYNLLFLNSRQALANDMLKERGYLFLNDVYDMLDIPRTEAGQVVGWVYDKHDPYGDNYIDFGIYRGVDASRARDFVNGYERSILLDFNVAGDILGTVRSKGLLGKI